MRRSRKKPERAARGGLIGVALFTLAMGGTSALGWQLLWRFAAGVASALVLVGVSSWALGALAARGRSAWSGWVFAGVGVGIAFAGVLGDAPQNRFHGRGVVESAEEILQPAQPIEKAGDLLVRKQRCKKFRRVAQFLERDSSSGKD